MPGARRTQTAPGTAPGVAWEVFSLYWVVARLELEDRVADLDLVAREELRLPDRLAVNARSVCTSEVFDLEFSARATDHRVVAACCGIRKADFGLAAATDPQVGISERPGASLHGAADGEQPRTNSVHPSRRIGLWQGQA